MVGERKEEIRAGIEETIFEKFRSQPAPDHKVLGVAKRQPIKRRYSIAKQNRSSVPTPPLPLSPPLQRVPLPAGREGGRGGGVCVQNPPSLVRRSASQQGFDSVGTPMEKG